MFDTAVAQDLGSAAEDTKENLPWIVGFLGAVALWSALSAGMLYAFEHERQGQNWTFLRAPYFTALNVLTGEFPDGINPKTRKGKVLTIVNAGAGLLLMGCLVGIVGLAFQRSEPTRTAEIPPAPKMLVGSEASKLYFDSSASAVNDISAADRRFFPDEETARLAGFRRQSDSTLPGVSAPKPDGVVERNSTGKQ